MKTIPLTQGKAAIVDNDDYEELSKHKWYARKNCRTFYARRNTPTKNGRRTVHMHRVIMGVKKGLFIDHINSDGLDNRKANLRICTMTQNNQHNQGNRNSSSKFTGVCWQKVSKKWVAHIGHGRKIIHLGSLESEVLAAKAFDDKASELRGEFAYLNFPHRLKKRNIAGFLRATRGKMFSVTFIKRSDNTERTLVATIAARTKEQGRMPYCPAEKKLIVVFDVKSRKYKAIPADAIEAITFNRKRYRVD